MCPHVQPQPLDPNGYYFTVQSAWNRNLQPDHRSRPKPSGSGSLQRVPREVKCLHTRSGSSFQTGHRGPLSPTPTRNHCVSRASPFARADPCDRRVRHSPTWVQSTLTPRSPFSASKLDHAKGVQSHDTTESRGRATQRLPDRHPPESEAMAPMVR